MCLVVVLCAACFSLTRPRPPSPLDRLAARALSSQPPLSSALGHSGARPLWRSSTLAFLGRLHWSSGTPLCPALGAIHLFVPALTSIRIFTSFDLLLASSLACLLVCACVRVGSAITHRCCNTSALGCSTLCCPSAPLFWPRSGAQHFGAQHWRSTLTLSCPCHSVLSGDLVALTPSYSVICGDQPPLAFDRGSRPLR